MYGWFVATHEVHKDELQRLPTFLLAVTVSDFHNHVVGVNNLTYCLLDKPTLCIALT